MIVEHAIRRPHHGLAVSMGIPSYTDARLEIVRVRLNSLLQSQQIVCGQRQSLRWRELGGNLHIVAQPVVKGEPWIDAPRVLPECANGNVLEFVARTADALDEVSWQPCAIRLHRR